MNEYEYVCETPSGYGLFRRKNKAGGYTYMIGELDVIIWDTSIVSDCDILCAIVEEHHRKMKEIHRSKNES